MLSSSYLTKPEYNVFSNNDTLVGYYYGSPMYRHLILDRTYNGVAEVNENLYLDWGQDTILYFEQIDGRLQSTDNKWQTSQYLNVWSNARNEFRFAGTLSSDTIFTFYIKIWAIYI